MPLNQLQGKERGSGTQPQCSHRPLAAHAFRPCGGLGGADTVALIAGAYGLHPCSSSLSIASSPAQPVLHLLRSSHLGGQTQEDTVSVSSVFPPPLTRDTRGMGGGEEGSGSGEDSAPWLF